MERWPIYALRVYDGQARLPKLGERRLAESVSALFNALGFFTIGEVAEPG